MVDSFILRDAICWSTYSFVGVIDVSPSLETQKVTISHNDAVDGEKLLGALKDWATAGGKKISLAWRMHQFIQSCCSDHNNNDVDDFLTSFFIRLQSKRNKINRIHA